MHLLHIILAIIVIALFFVFLIILYTGSTLKYSQKITQKNK